MPKPADFPTTLEFEQFRLDPEGRLTHSGQTVPLPPKEAAVLRLLAERAGRTVSKTELFARVWPGAAPSDESLTRCVYALRAALGDEKRPRRFIETAHSRGYRFVSEVRPVPGGARGDSWLERAAKASPRVFETFLQVRWLWHRRSARDMTRAVAMLKQIVEWDPTFAPAHGALADFHALQLSWGLGWPRELAPSIGDEVARALELDPRMGSAKATLAYVRSVVDWDSVGADRLFAEAIEADPTSSEAHWYHMLHLVGQRRNEEALRSAATALELDPFGANANVFMGFALYFTRRFDEALEQGRRTVDLDPLYGPAYGFVALSCTQLGRPDDALAAARRWVELSPEAPGARSSLACALARIGDRTEASRIVDEAEREARTRNVLPSTFAPAALALGDREDAFAWLELAAEQRCPWLGATLIDARLDPIRHDSRYDRVVAAFRGARHQEPAPAV